MLERDTAYEGVFFYRGQDDRYFLPSRLHRAQPET